MKRALVLALSAGLTLLVLLVPALASAAVPYQVQWLDTQENPSCETADLGAHDGEPFFRVNDTPLPSFQIPGALVTNADGSETNGFKLIIGHISTARGSSCHRGPQERHVEAAPPPGNKFPGYTNEVCSPAGDHTEQHRPAKHHRGSEQVARCTVSRRSPATFREGLDRHPVPTPGSRCKTSLVSLPAERGDFVRVAGDFNPRRGCGLDIPPPVFTMFVDGRDVTNPEASTPTTRRTMPSALEKRRGWRCPTSPTCREPSRRGTIPMPPMPPA
jgi:hypothetical protein